MTDGLTVGGKRELTPSQVGEYIHNVAELEKDIYTLKQMEKEIKTKPADLEKRFRVVDNSSKPVLVLETPQKKPEFSYYSYELFYYKKFIIRICLTAWLAISAIFFAISNVSFFKPYIPYATYYVALGFPINIVISLIIALFYTIIANIIGYIDDRKSYKSRCERVEEHNRNLDSINAKIREKHEIKYQEYEQECAKVNEYNESVKNQIRLVEKQAELIRQRRVELEKLRSQFYSIGIIPPDYRTMDCVYGLDHIFRNGLADTVREAVLQYEERVFKGQVIKGMGAILSQLQSLGSQMSYLVNDIHTINRNVEFMSQDLSNLADAQSRSQKTLDSILEESKATRYANEAIQKHNKEIQKHLDDARNYFGY